MSSSNNKATKNLQLIALGVILFFIGCLTTILILDRSPTISVYTTVQHTDRKGTIAFIFDDAFDTDVDVIDSFKDFNMRCGFALIGSKISKVKGRYLAAQKAGFEVLSHSHDHDYFTPSGGKPSRRHFKKVEEVEEQMRRSYQELTAAGFKVRGWVTPYSSLDPAFLPILKKYYEYGFTVLTPPTDNRAALHNFNTELRTLSRMSMESNDINSVKAQIDTCIKNKLFCVFYAHKLNVKLSDRGLREILAYAAKKRDALELDVMTPADGIDKYFAIDHQDLLKLLN